MVFFPAVDQSKFTADAGAPLPVGNKLLRNKERPVLRNETNFITLFTLLALVQSRPPRSRHIRSDSPNFGGLAAPSMGPFCLNDAGCERCCQVGSLALTDR